MGSSAPTPTPVAQQNGNIPTVDSDRANLTYADASAPLPSMPDQQMPSTRQGTVTEQNPFYNPNSGLDYFKDGQEFDRYGAPKYTSEKVNVNLTPDEKNKWIEAQGTLQTRYTGEAQQEQTLMSTIQGARNRMSQSGARNSTILTGPGMGMTTGGLGAGTGKTVLGG